MESINSPSWHALFNTATSQAQQGHYDTCIATCQIISDTCPDSAEAFLSIGSLLLSHGFLSAARTCFLRARTIAPGNPRAVMCLASLARDGGDHVEARRLYVALLDRIADQPAIRRSALMTFQYDPEMTNAGRLGHAIAWGKWAIAGAGGPRARPAIAPLTGRPLRVGYVSADFWQHTVGLFIKDVLVAHDPARVTAFAYSAGSNDDWVTQTIRGACAFRDVRSMDDTALAAQISRDQIDVLVDLSGHTGGSRLTVFAHRPAPVQVSWLGYFATTGLPTMDAVLLDEWHAPPGTESQFVEPIMRLPAGRFFYTPMPFAPDEVSVLPVMAHGAVTFGSFNNTAKFNDSVYDAWAAILAAVPESRLVLKWRTFHDAAFCQSVLDAFRRRGIDGGRIELRGASFHGAMLRQYADIDIALDPFPFTGGLTSCEALWMGVPVVTWPQAQVVSRQTFAFLSVIGLPELAARDRLDYVRIAVDLANDLPRLMNLRATLRDRMRASSLCQVAPFTLSLEAALLSLAAGIAARTPGQ